MSNEDQDPSLGPLFPVAALRTASVGAPPAADGPRDGYLAPVEVVFVELNRPVIVIELGFWPKHAAPEPLAPESWTAFCVRLGLSAFAGQASFELDPDCDWELEFGPHTLVCNRRRSFQILAPRADETWERAVQSGGSAIVLFGTGLTVNEKLGALGVGSSAAAVTAVYGGSIDATELAEIPGLHVVAINSLRSYDPIRAQSFVLDTDVLIEIERFYLEPSRQGERADAIRDVLVNIAGRDVLPGAALAQLAEPARTRRDPALAERALAAFEHVMSLSRREIVELREPPTEFPKPAEAVAGMAGDNPHVLLMYAGVLRLRQLWRPSHTFTERSQRFESFLLWMRRTLRLNAGLLVQVAFNLWMADDDAHRQASKLLRFRAATVTERDLASLWGTAFDLSLILGQAAVPEIANVPDAVILTFDQGLAQMRQFFEHVQIAEVPGVEDRDLQPWNARVWMRLHPRLEHKRARIAELIADLQLDAIERLSRGQLGVSDLELLTLIEEEEQRLLAHEPSR